MQQKCVKCIGDPSQAELPAPPLKPLKADTERTTCQPNVACTTKDDDDEKFSDVAEEG
ncbi:MAG: hypothetical protein M1834_006847 [Cirrosporium novae-zelandiae]|nr:MAG: hypothetical protein M1834_006847 [Cirrosporium novae-zelandiae]